MNFQMKSWLKFMNKFLKCIWQKLDNKKRIIALVYWSITIPVMSIIWPEHAPAIIDKTVQVLGVILSAVGLGHAYVKSNTKQGE